MPIVLDEHEWASECVKRPTLGQKPFETLKRVARYYIDSGYKRGVVRRLMDTYVLQCDPSASLPKWADIIDTAVKYAVSHPAICLDYIPITDTELEYISTIKGKQAQRLAFTLLCLAKYWDAVHPTNDGWVNTKDSAIMRMADINTSIKRQSALFQQLRDCGAVSFSKKVDNTNVKVLFQADGHNEIMVTDFRELGYQYMRYCGETYKECEVCGVLMPVKKQKAGRPRKYCPVCAHMMQRRAGYYGQHTSRA